MRNQREKSLGSNENQKRNVLIEYNIGQWLDMDGGARALDSVRIGNIGGLKTAKTNAM